MQNSVTYICKAKRHVENSEPVSLRRIEWTFYARKWIKVETKLNKNLSTTKKTIGDLNERNSETFFKAVKFFSQPKIGVSMPMLIKNKERFTTDTEKANKFEKIFGKSSTKFSALRLNLWSTRL